MPFDLIELERRECCHCVHQGTVYKREPCRSCIEEHQRKEIDAEYRRVCESAPGDLSPEAMKNRAVIRHLFSEIAQHIDPDVTIEVIKLGEPPKKEGS